MLGQLFGSREQGSHWQTFSERIWAGPLYRLIVSHWSHLNFGLLFHTYHPHLEFRMLRCHKQVISIIQYHYLAHSAQAVYLSCVHVGYFRITQFTKLPEQSLNQGRAGFSFAYTWDSDYLLYSSMSFLIELSCLVCWWPYRFTLSLAIAMNIKFPGTLLCLAMILSHCEKRRKA